MDRPQPAPWAAAANHTRGDSGGEGFDLGREDPFDPYEHSVTADEAQKQLRDLIESSMGADFDVDMSEATVDGFNPGIRLLPHQVQGRAWMRSRETGKKYGGILADVSMGLGKTIQTLCRIVEGKPSKEDLKKSGGIAATLIVAPVGLIAQWASEVEKMCTGLKVIQHHGPTRTTDPQVLAKADIIVTSYSIIASEHAAYASSSGEPEPAKSKSKKKQAEEKDGDSDVSDDSLFGRTLSKKKVPAKPARKKKEPMCALFKNSYWRIVLDEAQNVKNHNTKCAQGCFALQGKYRWCLTGTPIQNGVEELFSLLKFLRVRPLNDWTTFRTTIAKPIKDGRTTRPIKRIQVVLKAIMLRRLKTQTINGEPLLKLPDRNVEIVPCQFDKDELEFYKNLEERTSSRVDDLERQGNIQKNYTAVLLMLLRLRQACDHPSLISKDYRADADAIEMKPAAKDEDEGKEADELADLFGKLGVDSEIAKCNICQIELERGTTSQYCTDCELQVAIQARRKSIVSSNSDLPPSSAKIRKMLEILSTIEERTEDDEAPEKTIIFSQFTSMLDLIEPFLRDAGIRFVRYDGSMVPKKREEALDKLRTSKKVRVILISFKAGSTGLNLTACNNVILMDLWWNPAIEDQAFDRTHRLGQTKHVFIYKLTIPATVEERILGLQESKRALATAALSGDKMKNNRLGLDELMKLFSRNYDKDDED
ncbi:hypothetical protein BOTBODRAFT_112769 [Botryobasidium botryosum FD-172 SS1]|uniref:Helicase ATP-binding domain-containing protein n=1 Tax=Botryobasidium botryosum (strain FD-172 SS1) TaxID=930990 RepID=A0A067MLR9_BOTB1|nr:hypothetical protein BOTBODRAFT_112769 [Botryobasidium botryosum FD-172 SS1]